MSEVIKTFCGRLCGGTCGIIVTVDKGKIVDIKGDPDSPFSRGAICAKGRNLKEIIYHPDRLKRPLKRTGERGANEWQEIGMDEALNLIADRLQSYARDFGPESIMIFTGASRGGMDIPYLYRLAAALGTPNQVSSGNVCHIPRDQGATFTFGSACLPDYDAPPKCLVIWGSNTHHTNSNYGTGAQYRKAIEAGARFIVIDPCKTTMAGKADIWLKLRPGSDGLLALGMLNVIIGEGLYDRDFVSRLTVGFEQLKDFVASYPPSKVSKLTWVPAETLVQAARLYATTRPAAIEWGNAIDQTSNTIQTCRAISILRAITGNLDILGGDILPAPVAGLMKAAEFMLTKKQLEWRKKSLAPQHRVADGMFFVASQTAMPAILEQKPYPLKAGLVFGVDPLLTYANSSLADKGFRALDFLVVSDLFMSPTAALADVVLPVAVNLEFDDIGHFPGRNGWITARPKVVEPPGECLPDVMIISRLAQKLGLGQYFWDNEVGALDAVLQPAGLSYSDLKKTGMLRSEVSYRKYEKEGFRTPSGKVELVSSRLQQVGYDGLPVINEPPETPFGSPELAREYPLVLTSGKSPFFQHASHRMVSSLRKLSPEPVVKLNPETAKRYGLRSGDTVAIETPHGRIRQKLELDADIDPRVVIAAFGWWFPERPVTDDGRWQEANLNMLTSDVPVDPAMGTPNLRGLVCRVCKA
ncbi:MAG: molybdopterin-dependent oxidoreductase [Chloroflexota bacterium]